MYDCWLTCSLARLALLNCDVVVSIYTPKIMKGKTSPSQKEMLKSHPPTSSLARYWPAVSGLAHPLFRSRQGTNLRAYMTLSI